MKTTQATCGLYIPSDVKIIPKKNGSYEVHLSIKDITKSQVYFSVMTKNKTGYFPIKSFSSLP